MIRISSVCGGIALMSMATAYAAPATYDSPEAAVDAVIAALDARDRDALIAVFGEESEDVILSGDIERDRTDWGTFLSAYRELSRIAEQTDGTARLYVGQDQWPFPITLVPGEGGWMFDTASAADEIAARRIGRNELDVIDVMKAYAEVQSDYRTVDYDEDGVMEFAAHIISSEGTRDGLYWPDEDGAPESPIGDFMARAAADGYSIDGEDVDAEPYLGYYFHLLTEQGPNAPGGELTYMINGNMVAGHALIAFPASYGETGIMSFMVGEAGVVYEADLGEDSLEIGAAITAFDPGAAWIIADDASN